MNKRSFQTKDRTVTIWRPNKAEPTPPINAYALPHQCRHCSAEAAEKENWDQSRGTASEWLEQLPHAATVEQCNKWWATINKIIWQKEDEKRLSTAYVRHLSIVVSKEIWGVKNNAKLQDNKIYPTALKALQALKK